MKRDYEEDDSLDSMLEPPKREDEKIKEALEYVLTFGKHEGEMLSDVPSSYVRWCLDTFDRDERPELYEKLLIREMYGDDVEDEERRGGFYENRYGEYRL